MMKLTRLLLCVFFLIGIDSAESSTATKGNSLLRFVAKSQGAREFGLYLVMEDRCYRYYPEAKAKLCANSSNWTIDKLDFDVVFNENNQPLLLNKDDADSFVFVAFKTKLQDLLKKPETGAYLEHVLNVLNKFLSDSNHGPVSLWDESVAHFKSEKLAAEALAVLLQDTSPRKLHLGWLQIRGVRGGVNFEQNVHTLDRLIDTINFIMDTTPEVYRDLFYPKEVKRVLNRNIYHFYVPLYLTHLLQGSMTKEASLMGPLMMTLSYEFITAASDLRYLFKDPQNVSAQSILDIYNGYAGGKFGIGPNLESLDQVKNAFLKSTSTGVQLLVR